MACIWQKSFLFQYLLADAVQYLHDLVEGSVK